jgi:hypothetical protein
MAFLAQVSTQRVITKDISTLTLNVSSATANTISTALLLNSLRVGTLSSLTSVSFPGLTQTYQNTALAEISTGAGTQELLLYKVSSASDRVRVQTTGAFVVETGVSARSWPTTTSNVTPAFVINTSSNVGIQTATPEATLDVAGTVRAQAISSLAMFGSSLLTTNVSTQFLTVQSSMAVVGRSQSTFAFVVNISSQIGLNTSTPLAQFYMKDLTSPLSNPPMAIFDKDPTSMITSNQAYTGVYVFYTVPSAVTSITFNLWGAGGQSGGGGAFVQATVPTTPGEQLRLIIGLAGNFTSLDPTDAQGGAGSNTASGFDGRGGGRTALQKFIGGQWVEVLTAGGGGGGTTAFGGASGGNAYWIAQSQDGGSLQGYVGGGGATQIAGGTAGPGAGGGGGAGTFQKGGVSRFLGGSGGGGYYGGGGGYTGGGGASFSLSTLVGASFVTNYTGINGNGGTPIATTAFGYTAGVGVSGGNGLLALQYNGFRESDYADFNRGGTTVFSVNSLGGVAVAKAAVTSGYALDVAGNLLATQATLTTVSTLNIQLSTINGQPFGSFSGSTIGLSAGSILVSSINGDSPIGLSNVVSTTRGLGTLGYLSTQTFASYSFFTVSSGTSYTAAPYGQQLMTLSNLSYQFAPIQLSNDGITLTPSTTAAFAYRISYMTGVNQDTFMVPRPTITMAISTSSNVVYYPSVESIDAGGGSVTFLELLTSNSQLLFYMNGLSNYTFTDADSTLYRMSFEQIAGSVGQVFSTTYVQTSLADFTSTATFYENVTMKKSTFMSNAYVTYSTVTNTLLVNTSTITETLYTNYLRVMCNAIIGPSSVTIEANTVQTSNLQTSTISLLDQSTMTYNPFFISSGSIYYGSNVASAGGGGGTAIGGSTLSSLFVGSSSNQNFIKFWGSIGEYNNTVIAQQSTGGGNTELLLFEGSSINDQIRFQTTGSIRFETGVSQPRNFLTSGQVATPSLIINSSSNVGILTNNPTFTLDVAGTGRFQTLVSSPTATIGALLVGVTFV